MAIYCAKTLGMNLNEITKSLKKIQPSTNQMELKKGKNNINIIDSTYSSNFNGVISHLDYLNIWPEKKIIIMPCLIELGSASSKIHTKIGEKIGEICDFAIITTKERFEELKIGAIKSGLKEENIIFSENGKEILEKLNSFLNKENVILLEVRTSKNIIEKILWQN